jgi:hypothetical protein
MDIKVKRKSSRDRVDWDDKLETIELELQIKNTNLGTDMTGLQVLFLGIARNVDSKKRYLLVSKAKFTCDIKGGQTYVYDEIPTVSLQYDKAYSAHYGYKYYSHVVVVRDSGGQLLKADSTQSKWLKIIDRLAKIKVEKEVFTDKGRVTGKPRRSSSGMLW